MTVEFKLPDVGEGLDEAEIIEWLVTVGETIVRDQPLVEILTDKSQTQLPSPVGGIVTGLGFAVGDVAHVGQVLVVINASSGAAASKTTRDDSSAPRPTTAASPRPKASPAIRRKALEQGIELGAIQGSGPGGRILDTDLAAPPSNAQVADHGATSPDIPSIATGADPSSLGQPAAAMRHASPLGQMPFGRQPLRGIRRVTAQAMQRSWEIPHIHGNDELDATTLLAGRARIRELHPDRAESLTPMAFFVMAVANALRRYPLVNASIDVEAGEIVVHERVNIGIAVASEAGLVVPVIQDADRNDLFANASAVAELGAAARDRSITAAQMAGGTCTITNYGSLGGRFASPIIKSPEAAIVGFGSIRPRPFVVDGVVMARPTLPVATAVDHRLIDGDLMTAFQEHIMALLTDPVALLAI